MAWYYGLLRALHLQINCNDGVVFSTFVSILSKMFLCSRRESNCDKLVLRFVKSWVEHTQFDCLELWIISQFLHLPGIVIWLFQQWFHSLKTLKVCCMYKTTSCLFRNLSIRSQMFCATDIGKRDVVGVFFPLVVKISVEICAFVLVAVGCVLSLQFLWSMSPNYYTFSVCGRL